MKPKKKTVSVVVIAPEQAARIATTMVDPARWPQLPGGWIHSLLGGYLELPLTVPLPPTRGAPAVRQGFEAVNLDFWCLDEAFGMPPNVQLPRVGWVRGPVVLAASTVGGDTVELGWRAEPILRSVAAKLPRAVPLG